MKYEKTKGHRLKSKFRHVVPVFDRTKDETALYWNDKAKKWGSYEEVKLLKGAKMLSTCSGKVRSVRAFRRHLRKYGIPGQRYALVSFFMNYDVEAVCR